VKDKDFDFRRERVILLDGLLSRRGNGDGQVAGDFFRANAFSWERQHVGGFVFAAKLAVELANRRVGGEQNRDLTLEADGFLSLGKEATQRASRGQAEIFVGDGVDRPLR